MKRGLTRCFPWGCHQRETGVCSITGRRGLLAPAVPFANERFYLTSSPRRFPALCVVRDCGRDCCSVGLRTPISFGHVRSRQESDRRQSQAPCREYLRSVQAECGESAHESLPGRRSGDFREWRSDYDDAPAAPAGYPGALDIRRTEPATASLGMDLNDGRRARTGRCSDDEHLSSPAPYADGDESRHRRGVDGSVPETRWKMGDHSGTPVGCSEQPEHPDKPVKTLLLRISARCVDRRFELLAHFGLAADDRAPGQLRPPAKAFLCHLNALRRDRDHVGLAVDRDFALQGFLEFCRHAPSGELNCGFAIKYPGTARPSSPTVP